MRNCFSTEAHRRVYGWARCLCSCGPHSRPSAEQCLFVGFVYLRLSRKTIFDQIERTTIKTNHTSILFLLVVVVPSLCALASKIQNSEYRIHNTSASANIFSQQPDNTVCAHAFEKLQDAWCENRSVKIGFDGGSPRMYCQRLARARPLCADLREDGLNQATESAIIGKLSYRKILYKSLRTPLVRIPHRQRIVRIAGIQCTVATQYFSHPPLPPRQISPYVWP